MSVIRNSRSSTNKKVTIKRFVAGHNFEVLHAGTQLEQSFKPLLYLQMKDAYLGVNPNRYHIDKTTPIVVKCEIASDANGFIFGSPTGLSITVANGTVAWLANGQKHSVALEEGVHTYGFIFGTVNDTDGFYPFYDGACYGSEVTTTNITTFYVGAMAGSGTSAAVSGNPITSSGTWAMRVYEIAGTMKFIFDSSTITTIVHFYASDMTIMGTAVLGMRDTRSDYESALMIKLSSSGTLTAGEAVTYGMQLPGDLRAAWGTQFKKDLMAMVCEDDTNKAEQNADPADVVSNGTNSYNMAFRLANGANTAKSDVPSFPSGYSLSRTGTYNHGDNYVWGDLIYGRTPKWNIWSNSITWGKHVYNIGTAANPVYVLKFNVFKDRLGNFMKQDGNGKPLLKLESFDGYNNSDTIVYPPKIYIISGQTELAEITVAFHNSVGCKIDNESLLIGDASYPSTIFRYMLNVAGTAKFRIGNAVYWNVPAATQHQYPLYEIWAARVEFCKVTDIDHPLLHFEAETPDRDAQDHYIPFSSNSAASTIAAFRKNGVDATGLMYESAVNDMYHEFKMATPVEGVYTIPIMPKMSLVSTEYGSGDYKLISLENFVNFDRINLNGLLYNNKDRFIIGEDGGTCTLAYVKRTFKTVTPANGKTYGFYDFSSTHGTGSSTRYWHHLSYAQDENRLMQMRTSQGQSYWMVTVGDISYYVMAGGLSTDNSTVTYPTTTKNAVYDATNHNNVFDILTIGATSEQQWTGYQGGDILHNFSFSFDGISGRWQGFGVAFVLKPHTLASNEAGYTHKFVDFDNGGEDGASIEMFAYAECIFCKNNNVNGKFYGFAAVVPVNKPQGEQNWYDVFNNTYSNTFTSTNVQPSSWKELPDASSVYYEEIEDSNRRMALWRWQQLRRRNEGSNERPLDSSSYLTTHVRLFDASIAPHGYDVRFKDDQAFDPVSGCPYIHITNHRDGYYALHNVGEISTDTTVLARVVMTAWTTMPNPAGSAQIKNGSNFPWPKIYVYEEETTMAHEDRTINPLANITMNHEPSTTAYTQTSGDVQFTYRLASVDDFYVLPNGLGGIGLDNFVVLEIGYTSQSGKTAKKGAMYYVDITNP